MCARSNQVPCDVGHTTLLLEFLGCAKDRTPSSTVAERAHLARNSITAIYLQPLAKISAGRPWHGDSLGRNLEDVEGRAREASESSISLTASPPVRGHALSFKLSQRLSMWGQ